MRSTPCPLGVKGHLRLGPLNLHHLTSGFLTYIGHNFVYGASISAPQNRLIKKLIKNFLVI